MAHSLGICPKCQGKIFLEDGERKCINCGWTGSNHRKMDQYYNANLEAIAKTYRQHGRKGLMKQWLIPAGSIGKLLKRSGVQPILLRKANSVSKDNASLPALPAWNENWGDQVKVIWLETYRCLATKQ